jgi:hypothetical protein
MQERRLPPSLFGRRRLSQPAEPSDAPHRRKCAAPSPGPSTKVRLARFARADLRIQNGCYGGWWCDGDQCPPAARGLRVTERRRAFPTMGSTGFMRRSARRCVDVSRLLFAVVGDTRPANPRRHAGYPRRTSSPMILLRTSTAGSGAASPPFGPPTGTGDSSVHCGRTQAGPQLGISTAAAVARYTGLLWPGRWAITSARAARPRTAAPTWGDGITVNYAVSFRKMLRPPLSKTLPSLRSHLCRFRQRASSAVSVFKVAANAWSAEQAVWPDATLSAQP